MNTRKRFGGLTVLPLALLPVFAGSALGQVSWRSGSPAPAFAAGETAGVLKTAASRAKYTVVHLRAPITEAGREELGRLGLTLLAPLGDNTFFASLRADARTSALAANSWLAGAALVKPEWKLDPRLQPGQPTPSWTIREGDRSADPLLALYITFFDDAPAGAVADVILKNHGGAIVDVLNSINVAVVNLPRSQVAALAAEDQVQYVEPALPLMVGLNAENRALTGANTVNAAPYNLNGTGVKVFVFDAGGVRTTHVDLAGRVTIIDGSSPIEHSTHCAGTVGGNGTAVLNNRGMAPGVTFLSAAINISQSGWLYTNPADIEADYTAAYNQGAHIATNSIGTNVANNGFSCSWEGDYNTTDRLIDNIVRGALPVTQSNPFRIVWAAGNERGNGRCGTTYNTIGPPAGAKNHLSIGSVDSNTDNVSSFSGWGPTDDGRMKPDFCAPGCQTNGDGGVTSCSNSTNSYSVLCGTSMATPTTAGCAALLMQDWRAQFPGSPDPRNSTLKVFFAQTAVDRGNPGPDYQYGYGSIRIPAAIDLMRTRNFRESTVSQAQDVYYDLIVPPATNELAVTLAWDDAPGTVNANPILVNDLDLEVFSPTNVQAFPWTLNPASPSSNAVRTQKNSRDNLEQVRVTGPAAGVWRVRVRGFNVPSGPQPFSIVASNQLTIANDACAAATPVTTGTTTFSTVGATTDGPQEPNCSFCCGDAQVNQDIWYTFTAPCTGTATLSMCGTASYDTKVAIYSGSGCPTQDGTAIACDDDFCSTGGPSQVSWAATSGATYKIRIGGYLTATGSGSFNLTCAAGNSCYANCDGSTTPPVLTVLDFNCFSNAFANGASYANCDGSTTPPLLTVLDFNCFMNAFAAGCP
jgi:hypothetical protein